MDIDVQIDRSKGDHVSLNQKRDIIIVLRVSAAHHRRLCIATHRSMVNVIGNCIIVNTEDLNRPFNQLLLNEGVFSLYVNIQGNLKCLVSKSGNLGIQTKVLKKVNDRYINKCI